MGYCAKYINIVVNTKQISYIHYREAGFCLLKSSLD